ncbi:MAG: sigma-70 family RNA polymerase sigma factor [Verrucomicrobiales bacterium]|nr:sigma-70 family RNA polymerase sigma factor [Verrucomicrobiales bacterium]
MASPAEAPGEETDEALFARVANGDSAAFAMFYDRHDRLLYSLALRIVQNDAEAQDVVQEAAVLIWERAPHYDARLGRPISWAITLVRNKAIDRLRSARRRAAMLERREDETVEAGIGHGEPLAEAAAGDTMKLVRRSLESLPREQRQAIELAFLSGFSQSEIAERLREPLGTIKARIRRGMIAMRDALEGAL